MPLALLLAATLLAAPRVAAGQEPRVGDAHGFVAGVDGSHRIVPEMYVPAVALELGYYLRRSGFDHVFTVAGGMSFGSGNCAENGYGVRIAYSLRWVHRWLLVGGEVAGLGISRHRCVQDGDGVRRSRKMSDYGSIGLILGGRHRRFEVGLSARLGLAGSSFGRHGTGPPDDGGGQPPFVDVGPWLRVRL